MPVTQSRVQEIFEECRTNLITQVDVLGFEFEMGLQPRINQEFKEQGVDIRLRYIPKDVFDPRAVDKGQVKFYDVSYLQAKPIIKGNKVKNRTHRLRNQLHARRHRRHTRKYACREQGCNRKRSNN